jgi:Domain of unknown function (DUF5916)
MRHLLRCITLAAVFALFPAGARAAASAGASFTTVRAPHPLPLDPSLRDPAWQTGRIGTGGFWNVTTRSPAQLGTDVYALWDDRNLYVGFHADQRGVPLSAGQMTHNVGFGIDDFVGVAIDTSGAGNLVYFFETTPSGTRYQQASENARYDARWQSAAQRVEDGWNAVLIVPLNAMRLPGGPHKTWRLNFIRNVAARGEHYTWAYDGLMADGPIGTGWPLASEAKYWPFVHVEGIAVAGGSAPPKPRADVYVLGSGGTDRAQFAQADGTFRSQSVRAAGIDVTAPVTATISVVATLNPDFSNVEIDQQTIAPQEFQRALNEYRPFFAQGAKFLNPSGIGFSSPTSPNNVVFYSPRIGPFDRGVKVEGTFGLQSFGALAFRGFDQTTGDVFDDIAYGYKHALSDRSFEYWADGVVAHHSVSGSDTTSELGVLGQNRKSGIQWGTGAAFEHGSWVQGTGTAHSSTSFVALTKPNVQWAIGYNDLSPNYNPIDGITFNSDIHGFQTFAATSGSSRAVKNYMFSVNADRWFDESGAVHESDLAIGVTATFRNALSINALGPSFGSLRSYTVFADNRTCTGTAAGRSFFTGFPCYRDGRDERFNLFQAAIGYKDGTPRPIDLSVSFGPFGGNNTRLYSLTTSRPVGRLSLGIEYDGTVLRSLTTGALDSQWLRRISLGAPLDAESNLSVSVRSINGLGGFAPEAGTNLAFAYHRRFRKGDELFLNYGTPAAFSTLHRVVLKYVFHVNGDAGT